MTSSSGLQSVCNSMASLVVFFARVTCYPHHGRYEAESIRAALASPIDRDLLFGSHWISSVCRFLPWKLPCSTAGEPLPSCSVSLMTWTLSIPEQQERTINTQKPWSQNWTIYPMPCRFVHPILSCRFVHTADEYAHVCVCIYIYVYMYICIYICIYIYICFFFLNK